MPSFDEVADVVREEREYQKHLPRNEIKVQKPLETLAIIEVLIQKAKEDWYEKPGELDLNYIRKITATGFRIMEEHGAPRRFQPEVVSN